MCFALDCSCDFFGEAIQQFAPGSRFPESLKKKKIYIRPNTHYKHEFYRERCCKDDDIFQHSLTSKLTLKGSLVITYMEIPQLS